MVLLAKIGSGCTSRSTTTAAGRCIIRPSCRRCNERTARRSCRTALSGSGATSFALGNSVAPIGLRPCEPAQKLAINTLAFFYAIYEIAPEFLAALLPAPLAVLNAVDGLSSQPPKHFGPNPSKQKAAANRDFTGIVVMEVALKGQLLAALSAGRMPSGS
jgi:hypothetical protein